MIAILPLLAQATLPVPAPAPSTWAALPPLEFQRPAEMAADLFRFVRDEVEAGRCGAASVDAGGTSAVRVSVIVLVDAGGNARSVVPAAIGCPTVEQYTAGVIGRMATGNVRQPWPAASAWFRSGLVYSWTRAATRSR